MYCIVYNIQRVEDVIHIFFLILVHMHLSPYICSLFVIWTQCFVTVSTLYIFKSQFCCFLPCILSRYCQKFSQAELKWYPLIWYFKQKICCYSTFNAVVLYFYPTTCQIIILTCHICMLFFFQIFYHNLSDFYVYLSLIHYLFIKTCSCPVLSYRSKEHYLTSRHNIWKVKIKIL